MRKSLFATLFLSFVLALGAQPAEEPQLSAEDMAMMQAWMEAGTPGAHHAALAEQAGLWDVTVSMWMDPESDPSVSHGRSEREMILGGRVLQERFEGEAMGMSFTGLGLTGYDNVAREYWATWNDSMMTTQMTSRGQCSESGDKCVFMSSMYDPAAGHTIYQKTVVERKGDDREVMESWTIEPDGREVLGMRIVYDRVKEGE